MTSQNNAKNKKGTKIIITFYPFLAGLVGLEHLQQLNSDSKMYRESWKCIDISTSKLISQWSNCLRSGWKGATERHLMSAFRFHLSELGSCIRATRLFLCSFVLCVASQPDAQSSSLTRQRSDAKPYLDTSIWTVFWSWSVGPTSINLLSGAWPSLTGSRGQFLKEFTQVHYHYWKGHLKVRIPGEGYQDHL